VFGTVVSVVSVETTRNQRHKGRTLERIRIVYMHIPRGLESEEDI
jgi:hypothetical protein